MRSDHRRGPSDRSHAKVRIALSIAPLAVWGASIVHGTTPASGAPVIEAATVIAPREGASGPGVPLGEGATATAFSLELPEGAACAGDSTNGGYRVQSFMVPGAIDPSDLAFDGLGPTPRGRGAAFTQPLFEVDTSSYVSAATNLADEPGGPGTIINIPNFSLAVFGEADLPPGDYVLGIACTKIEGVAMVPDRLWVASMAIGASSDAAVPFSWTAASPRASEADDPDGEAAPPPAADAADIPSDAAGDDADQAAGLASATGSTGSAGQAPSFNLPVVGAITDLGPGGATPASLVLALVAIATLGRLGYLAVRAVQLPAHPPMSTLGRHPHLLEQR